MKRKSKGKEEPSTVNEEDAKSKLLKKQIHQKQQKKKQNSNALRENIPLYGMILSLIGFIVWCLMTPPVPVTKKRAAKSKKSTRKEKTTKQYTVLEVLPHDIKAFTQGLTYHDGKLYESTGGFQGESQIRVLDPTNGTNIHHNIKLDDALFGEGLTYFTDNEGNPRLLLITWKNQLGYIYDLDLNLIKEFKFKTLSKEGWGVTYNMMAEEFIVSDGTSMLYMWDRDTLEETRRVNVTITWAETNGTINTEPLFYLNELEFWNDKVLANVWYRDYIVAIDPETGTVTNSFDFSTLFTTKDNRGEHEVMNGISVINTDKTDDELIVTGKNWPNMYRVQIH